MRVNLLEKDEGIKIQWMEIVVALIVILIFAAPVLNYYLNYIEVKNLEQRADNWQTRIQALRPREERYYELQNEIENFRLPAKVELEKYIVSPFFLEFARIIGADITFNNLDYSSGQINISGNAENVRSLLDFSSRIFNSEVFSIISLERFQNNDQLEFNLVVELE
jgi:hypothetical protein